MAASMRRGKPTRRGIGSPSDTPGSDPPPAQGSLPRMTHRGLGDSQPPKLVTMHGVAPPSDRPPGMPEDLSKKTLELTMELGRLAPDPPPDFSDLGIAAAPFEEEQSEGEASEIPDDRAQFRTAPGGGRNRLSGGRAIAAAYVSPSTLAPGHGTEPKLGPVEVAEHVLREARSFQTEPSLVRKRASYNPQPPLTRASGRHVWIYAAGALIVLIVLVASQFIVAEDVERTPAAGAEAARTETERVESSNVKSLEAPAPIPEAENSTHKIAAETPISSPSQPFSNESGNAATNRPIQGHAASPSQNTQSLSPSAHSSTATPRTKPDVTPKPATKSTPRNAEPTGKKRDLWLE